jgi:hypothetical protein
MTYAHREAWLAAVVNHFKLDFEDSGYPLPDRLRVTCGWPSQGGLAQKARTIGECWNAKASADGTVEICISPYLNQSTRDWDTLVRLQTRPWWGRHNPRVPMFCGSI